MTLRSAVVGQFKRPRGVWGRAAGWIMANRPSNRRRNFWTVGLLEIDSGDRILEIGCGPGLALQACAGRLETGVAVGLDHSPAMLDQASERNAEAIAANRVSLRLGDLDSVGELHARFDKVFSVNVVQFFENRVESFRTLRRVTAPGGLVAATYQPRHVNPTRDDALRMADEIEGAMREAGLDEIRREELELAPVPAVCVIGRRPLP
jgi:cyclopropane fatty-acyl-phospholipid synthase-like methyltransferase